MVTKTVKATEVATTVNVTNSPEVVAALAAYVAAKAQIKAAEAIKADAEAIIRAAAGDAQTIIVRGIKAATISDPRTRTSYDGKVLREAFPEAAAATERQTTYTVLNVL